MIKSYLHLIPRYLLSNKKRTLAASLSIVLSVIMLTSVGIIVKSYNEKLIESYGSMFGNYHAYYANIEYTMTNRISAMQPIQEVGTSLTLGDTVLGDKPLSITGVDDVSAGMLNIKAIEGRLPEDTNEIIIEKWILDTFGTKLSIGDKLKLTVVLYNDAGQLINPGIEADFILCGIAEDSYGSSAALKGKSYVSLATAEQYIPNVDKRYRQYFKVEDSHKIASALGKVRELGRIKAKNENDLGDYRENNTYVKAVEDAYKSRRLIAVIDIIVALAAIMVIFNVFNISVVERIKQLGLLRAIGITPKQVKILLLGEALLLGVIFVPVGIISGILAIRLLLLIGANVGYMDLKVKLDSFIIILPLVTGFVSIFIAVYYSARAGSKVSVIESLNSDNKVLKHKAEMSSTKNRLMMLTMGQTGKMAFVNLSRNKKRFFATVISISISIALFLSINYLVRCLDPVYQMRKFIGSDYVLNFGFNKEINEYPVETINELRDLKGVLSVVGYKLLNTSFEDEFDSLTESGIKYIEERVKVDDYDKELYNKGKYGFLSTVIGLDDSLLEEIDSSFIDVVADTEPRENAGKAYLVQNYNYEDYTKFKAGDTITMTYTYLEGKTWHHVEKDFEIVKLLDEIPITMNIRDAGSVAVIIDERTFERLYGLKGYQKIEVHIDKNADKKLIEEKLMKIAASQKYGKFVSFEEDVQKMKKLQTQIALILYALIFVIALVGLINIVNTMSINIVLRKREFGVMRAIGVSKKQLRSMILKEGFLYGLVSSILGCAIGVYLIRVIYYAARKGLFMELYYDYGAIASAVFVTILLSILSTVIPLKRITKQNIVESIRAIE